MRSITLIFFILSISLFAQKKAPKEYDKEAKTLKPIKDKSIIYFINKNVSGQPKIYHDTTLFGQVQMNQFAYTVLNPGRYQFKVNSKSNSIDNTLTLNLQPNTKYFIGIERKGLSKPQTTLRIYDQQKSKNIISSFRLSRRSNIYYAF